MIEGSTMYSDRMFGNLKPLTGDGVTIAKKVTMGPGVVIHDNVTIEEGASIGPYVILGEPILEAYKSSNYENPVTVIGKDAIIRSGTVIYAGCDLGQSVSTGHYSVIRERTVCGEACSFGNFSTSDGDVTIGDRCRFSYYTHICKTAAIGNDVWMFPLSQLYNDLHPPCNRCIQGPRVSDRVVIGAGALVLPKVTIGEDSVIASGSLVSKDVLPGMLVLGSPARVVGPVDEISCKTGEIDHPYPWRHHYVRPR